MNYIIVSEILQWTVLILLLWSVDKLTDAVTQLQEARLAELEDLMHGLDIKEEK